MTLPLSNTAIIAALVRSVDAADAISAIRYKAAQAIEQYVKVFGEPKMPLNVEALASLVGITVSDDAPLYSQDAELAGAPDGTVTIRVNRDRPETRRRFSIGHEISHTFFPGYQVKPWCRTDARNRRRENPDDHIEMLCDVGSAELLMPDPWFRRDAAGVTTGAGLIELARKYGVSREAAVRRFAENHSKVLAAVFFAWKLKPIQHQTVGLVVQQRLFGNQADEIRRAKKLRVEYSIPSARFASSGYFLPSDKSVESEGPLYTAASTGQATQGRWRLDFGTVRGLFDSVVVPIWTPSDELGPNGENAVAAIVVPVDPGFEKPKAKTHRGTLFE